MDRPPNPADGTTFEYEIVAYYTDDINDDINPTTKSVALTVTSNNPPYLNE